MIQGVRFQIKFWVILIVALLTQTNGERVKRFLIFPQTNPTRIQWIIGFGIPLENLLYEAMTTGYVLKAEYFLPYTVDDLRIFRPMKFQARDFDNTTDLNLPFTMKNKNYAASKIMRNESSKQSDFAYYRWSVYKALESLAERIGYNGRICLLKSICEASTTPLHHYNGIFADLIHILLRPSSSSDLISEHSDNEYFHAENMGRTGADCKNVFKLCKISLLDIFTNVQQTS